MRLSWPRTSSARRRWACGLAATRRTPAPLLLLALDVFEDRVQHVYLLVNPDKMSRLRVADPS